MGRAMRCGKGAATYTLLYPAWCQGDIEYKPPSQLNDSQELSAEATGLVSTKNTQPNARRLSKKDIAAETQKRKDSERRKIIPQGLHAFLNSTTCLRRSYLAYFGDDTYADASKASPTPCCSVCNPEACTGRMSTVIDPKTDKETGDTLFRPWRSQELRKWREEKCKEPFRTSIYVSKALLQVLMSDATLERVAKFGNVIKDLKTLVQYGGLWPEAKLYHTEVIHAMTLPGHWPKSQHLTPAFDVWTAENDRKRGRNAATPTPEEEYLKRKEDWMVDKGFMSKPKSKKQPPSKQAKKPKEPKEMKTETNTVTTRATRVTRAKEPKPPPSPKPPESVTKPKQTRSPRTKKQPPIPGSPNAAPGSRPKSSTQATSLVDTQAALEIQALPQDNEELPTVSQVIQARVALAKRDANSSIQSPKRKRARKEQSRCKGEVNSYTIEVLRVQC